MKLKFKEDYPLKKIDIQIGEFNRVFERSQQPFELPDQLAESVLKTEYDYRIDKPNGKVGFERRLAFEVVTEQAKAPGKNAPDEKPGESARK